MFKVLSLGLIFFLSACGYQWGNRSVSLPGNHTRIAVPVFKNNTQEVGAEMYFTNAMIEEIIRSQRNNLSDSDSAEVVLEGELNSLVLEGEGLANFPEDRQLPAGTELVSTYQLNIQVNLRLRRKRDQKVIWTKTLNGEKTFASAKIAKLPVNSANPIYNHSAIHKNLQSLAEDLMVQAYYNLTESF